jgi:hypothetical protein
MRSVRWIWTIASLATLVACAAHVVPAFAHHSFGRYDMTKTSEITGTVRQFEWSNPHCWLFVDVASPNGGAAIAYGFEMSSVGELLRAGYTKTSMNVGDQVTVQFRPLKDGSRAGLLSSVMKDGKLIGRRGGGPPPATPNGAPPNARPGGATP